jgi:NADPH-dependent glutamate synthase beta subunit-like oxidoreductase/Pyruvate/2-oxoacid:ferredoxin oxidoreductase delta subunit
MSITLSINGNKINAEKGMTILEAAEHNDIYIPRLCYHPSLGSSHGLKPVKEIYREDGKYTDDGSGPKDGFDGCRLCLVEINGNKDLVTSCDTIVEEGMDVNSETDGVKKARQDNLVEILKDHPHACLQCAQQDGCSRTQCSTNVPEDERCCPLLGHCELQKIAQYIGIRQDLTKYVYKDLPKHKDEPLFERDDNLCISCLRCVRACRELRGIETLGFVFNKEKVIVGPTKSSMYDESDCRFCGTCVEVCPTGALTDKDLPRGEKEDVLVPCIANCPAGVDIPKYINLINDGKYAEADAIIRERLPFPGILGRVCFHPCEDACRRAELNQPMAICALKWFAADNDDGSFKIKSKKSTSNKIAIVGSGPAGLSAAYYLALLGHDTTVFEAEEKIGGMLRYALPDYRLTPNDLDKDLDILNDVNVKFKTNTPIGKKITISDLRKNFDAVFLASGAGLSKKITVEGSDLKGVEWGLDFLRGVKKKNVTSMSGRLVVIGGGNVAMDVARTAIRLGASEVQLACLECAKEMPAHDWEIEDAKEEGVIMHPSWGPDKILGKNGNVTGIELIKCTSVFDAKGKFAPEFDSCETKIIETDKVILAIGQSSDFSWMEGIDTKTGTITVNKDMQTNISGIFAGGEVARGPASVVESIADGASAASAIDKYLGGDGEIYQTILPISEPDPYIGKVEGFASIARVDIPKISPKVRITNFEMVENCYNENQAKQEAGRCLRCDLRLQIMPVTFPPDKWMDLNEDNLTEVPAVEGVFQLRDENKVVIVIKGSQNIQADLQEKLKSGTKAKYFWFETDPMYTKRESELIQQFLQQFGKMPEGEGEGDDLDDLF